MDKDMIIQVRDVRQCFRINDQLTIKAVEGVSFDMRKGEVFGLIGETGCGKSTIARIISGIYTPTEGEVFYDGVLVSGKHASKEQKKKMQREMQMVFQDSAASLNPRMTVEKIILEPLRIQNKHMDAREAQRLLAEMMENVGIAPSFASRRPGELSGGQRQRVAIARALMLDPRLVIADEPVASLDISIQAQIIGLFQKLQREKGFSFLFIAHDLSVVRFISDRIGVMLKGKLVELADTNELFANPIHPYTKSLLSAIHVPDPIYERSRKLLNYDTTKPLGNRMVECGNGHYVLEE